MVINGKVPYLTDTPIIPLAIRHNHINTVHNILLTSFTFMHGRLVEWCRVYIATLLCIIKVHEECIFNLVAFISQCMCFAVVFYFIGKEDFPKGSPKMDLNDSHSQGTSIGHVQTRNPNIKQQCSVCILELCTLQVTGINGRVFFVEFALIEAIIQTGQISQHF